MRTHRASDVSWTPVFVGGGRRVGVILGAPLALALSEMIRDDRDLLIERVWEHVRPEPEHRMPSRWIIFHEQSLLPLEFYKRHGGASGKWMSAERSDVGSLREGSPLTYSYHHADAYDGKDNRWLEFAFATYMTAMQSLLTAR